MIAEERAALDRGESDSREAAGANGSSSRDAEDVGGKIDQWQEEEIVELSGADTKPPIWVPRDPMGSLLISALDEFAISHGLTQESKAQGYALGDEPLSTLYLSDEARDLLTSPRKRFFPRFGERDARFLTWGAIAKISAWRKGSAIFPAGTGPTLPIDNDARLILLGDWGSGIPRAEKVGTAVRTFIEDSLRAGQQCMVIHLGDVYYCGWKREYESRFLTHWPVYPGEQNKVGSFCLNANHDMYSGGHDYFGFLLKEPRFLGQKGHSYFALENSQWQIAGLDTAYTDSGLHGDQAAWLEALRRGAPKKKGMLLSHHQPYTCYQAEGEKDSPDLLAALKPVLDEGLIRAWFWGHEHRCAAYAPTHGIQYPRLIGHGGVPVYAWAGKLRAGVSWENPETLTDPRTGWKYARFGFSVLDFKPSGTVHHRWIGENGNLQREEDLA